MASSSCLPHSNGMEQSFIKVTTSVLRVLIVTQSAEMGRALMRLLDTSDVVVTVEIGNVTMPHETNYVSPHLVLLDLEPWPPANFSMIDVLKARPRPPVVLALIHGVDPEIRQRCLTAGIDDVFDRTAELLRLTEVVSKASRQADFIADDSRP